MTTIILARSLLPFRKGTHPVLAANPILGPYGEMYVAPMFGSSNRQYLDCYGVKTVIQIIHSPQ